MIKRILKIGAVLLIAFALLTQFINVAFAADTQVDANALGNSDEGTGLWGPYWIDKDNGVIVFMDDGSDLNYATTDDGGSTWATSEVEAGTIRNISVWFDKETPSDIGDKVHIAWLDSADSDLNYVNYDIGTATLGTVRTVVNMGTVHTNGRSNRVSITKANSGRIYVGASTQTNIDALYSDDSFATAGTDIADVFELGTEEDWTILAPANTGDDDDIAAIFHDRSVTDLSIKMYDATGNSWTETNIDTDFTSRLLYINYDLAVRHSDGHILVAGHSYIDFSTDDLRTYDITPDSISTPTVTVKTDVFTDQAEAGGAAVVINQQNDDVYVAYIKGNTTWVGTTDVVYHKSTDDMGTWGSEQAYSETTDDIRLVQGGRTVGDDGGRIQFAFYNDDTTANYVNLVNDVEITAAGPAGVTSFVTIGNGILKIGNGVLKID